MSKPGFASRTIEKGLDALGTIDPTGIVDAGHAISLAARGRWTDAALTGAGVIPYVGDTAKLAKYAKYAKNAKGVTNLPGMHGMKEGLDGAINDGVEKARANGGLIGPMSSASPIAVLANSLGSWRANKAANAVLNDAGVAGPSAGMAQRQHTRSFAPG